MTQLRLGILGFSEGNGHPYSWASIFNGCNWDEAERCPFPTILQYLANQKFPLDCIPEAIVTHIWTQDKSISDSIAAFACIRNIVTKPEDMIGEVDAILLARDDAESHYDIAKSFIEAGIPIYIDKPLAYTVMEAKRILSLEKFPGQVFSCSALKYAEEFSASVLHDIGEIKVVNAKVIKSWKKYSIHIIDPVLKLIDADILESVKSCQSGITNLTVKFTNNTMAHFTSASTNDFPIEIEFFGTKQYRRMTFLKTFNAFKEALQHFIDIINRKAVPPSHEEILKSIRLVEMGSQL